MSCRKQPKTTGRLVKNHGHSKRAVPVGKPFAPGPDPRRHLQGRKSRDIIAFAAELNRELAEQIDARELVRVLKERAIRGNL
ncbi:MAG: hypothetical protein ABSG73_13195, partial [Candidatus Aminicenantales bacterium]